MSQTTRKCALFAALTAVVLLQAQAATAAPMIYAKIEGSRQGVLRGNSPIESLQDRTEVLKFAYSVNIPSTSQTVSGARQHGPVRITKVVGPASPQLFQALVTNEQLKTVIIDFLEPDEDGQNRLATSIKLTNARVVGIDQVTEEPSTAAPGAKGRNLENISFTFQTIEMIHVPTSASATDSLAVR